MDYAVIAVNRNQFLVKNGDKIELLGQDHSVGDVISDVKTLLIKDNDIKIGAPYLNYPISLKIVSLTKTDKVDIFKYKSKSRYRRHTGHRQPMMIAEVVVDTPSKPLIKTDQKTTTKTPPKKTKPTK